MTDSTKQAKAEKGLEPVAWQPTEPNVTCPVCHTALGARWLTQDDCEPPIAHPPTQVEPVATLIEQAIEQARTNGNEYVSSDKLTHILKLCDAHPPTSEWNAAEVADLIEALWRGDEGADADAARLIGQLTGVTTEHLPARALKREPR